MKRSLSLILSLILAITLLTSCALSDSEADFTPSGDFDLTGVILPEKKEVIYSTTYTAVDEIDYDTSSTLGTAQIEDKLYLLEPDGVYMADLADGTVSQIYSQEGLMFIASNGNELYVSDTVFIRTLDPTGALINTQTIPEGTFDKARFDINTGFIATDDYYVFACPYDKKDTHIYISKSDLSVTMNSEKVSHIICPYEANKYWYYYEDSQGNIKLIGYDIDTGKSFERYSSNAFAFEMEYDRSSGNFIFYYHNAPYGMQIQEFDPSDGSVKQLSAYLESEYSNKYFLTSCENIYTAVANGIKNINLYDMKKEYDILNVAVLGMPHAELSYLSYVMSDKYGINLNIKQFDYDNQKHIPLKLMAGDTDIDIFYNQKIDTPYYVKNDCYVDLNQFEILQENITAAKGLLKTGFSYNGRLFAIPFELDAPIVIDCMNPYTDYSGNCFAHNSEAYLSKYINLIDNTYTDDGDALLDLLEHYFDNKGEYVWQNMFDEVVCEEISRDTYIITGKCYMMNPASPNKDNAALLLNEILNLGLGKTDPNYPEFSFTASPAMDYDWHYDLDFDYSKATPLWMSISTDIGGAFDDAREEALAAESKSELRAIARKYHNMINQIIKE